MAKGTSVPITPSVLEWAIKESGYSPPDVAEKIKVPAETLATWIRGEAAPKLTEFRRLAALLKRTPATFLLPRPPEPSALPVEFREAPGSDRTQLNPVERRYLREANRLQDLLLWIQGELGEHGASLPRYGIDMSPEGVAAEVSKTILPKRPDAFRSASAAFDWYRSVLEAKGVMVFTFPLGREGVRGFSVWNERGPVVAVNTWWRVEARVYTLFHEFGHLLTRTSSACVEAGRRFSRPSDSVERWCEEFSAAVVLPRDAVRNFLVRELGSVSLGVVANLTVPSKLANRFRVSLRAATLRLIEMHLANWDLYAQIPPVSENKPPGGGGSGRDRGEIREDQFGDRAVRLMVRALGRDVLGRTDVLDALDISDTDLSKLERRVTRSA